jgi:hypothetical protein
MSLLVEVTEAIVKVIEDHRASGGFSVNDFVTEWDFEGRAEDDEALIADERLHVRVLVPWRWLTVRKFDRTQLEYIGQWEIDIRQKLGAAAQGEDYLIERDRLANLSAIPEEIHALLWESEPEHSGHRVMWCGEYGDATKQSEIETTYFPPNLHRRLFYGKVNEIFQVTMVH